MKRYHIFCISFISFFTNTYCVQESINEFFALIHVHTDGSVAIKEQISVQATGAQIKHGIVRELPTVYRLHGVRYSLRFSLQEVRLDNNSVPYKIEHVLNGVKIYIGDKNRYLTPGKHTYEISYKVQQVIGFFTDYDELYWNITGNGWRLPIKHASARIKLPFDITSLSSSDFGVWGYTGDVGAQEKNYRINISDEIVIETTQPLLIGEGLTVAIKWPKGLISEPNSVQRLWYFFLDNWADIILIVGLLLIIFIYLFALIKQYIWPYDRKTIIPLFYPPDKCSPGGVRYLLKQQYDHIGFAADLIDLAVRGCIVIDYIVEKNAFSTDVCVLKKSSEKPKTIEQSILMEKLFPHDQLSIIINKKNRLTLEKAFEALKNHYELSFDAYFERPQYVFGAAFFISLLMIPLIIFQASQEIDSYALLIAIILFVIHVFFYRLLKNYNENGQKYIREIAGFKLFLTTTELERMKIIGTPPTKNPHLFEIYLPYAVALEVEKQWRDQFASLFARLEKEHHPYVQTWLITRPGLLFDSSVFASQLQSVVISASATPPGFSSGSGGRGSSGGGAGGGGGGGW